MKWELIPFSKVINNVMNKSDYILTLSGGKPVEFLHYLEGSQKLLFITNTHEVRSFDKEGNCLDTKVYEDINNPTEKPYQTRKSENDLKCWVNTSKILIK